MSKTKYQNINNKTKKHTNKLRNKKKITKKIRNKNKKYTRKIGNKKSILKKTYNKKRKISKKKVQSGGAYWCLNPSCIEDRVSYVNEEQLKPHSIKCDLLNLSRQDLNVWNEFISKSREDGTPIYTTKEKEEKMENLKENLNYIHTELTKPNLLNHLIHDLHEHLKVNPYNVLSFHQSSGDFQIAKYIATANAHLVIYIIPTDPIKNIKRQLERVDVLSKWFPPESWSILIHHPNYQEFYRTDEWFIPGKPHWLFPPELQNNSQKTKSIRNEESGFTNEPKTDPLITYEKTRELQNKILETVLKYVSEKYSELLTIINSHFKDKNALIIWGKATNSSSKETDTALDVRNKSSQELSRLLQNLPKYAIAVAGNLIKRKDDTILNLCELWEKIPSRLEREAIYYYISKISSKTIHIGMWSGNLLPFLNHPKTNVIAMTREKNIGINRLKIMDGHIQTIKSKKEEEKKEKKEKKKKKKKKKEG
jgi:hypothetical protein